MGNEDNYIQVYSQGTCCMSICAPKGATIKDIEIFANQYSPTGIASKWKISEDKTFARGEPMPCVCSYNENKMHYLLNC